MKGKKLTALTLSLTLAVTSVLGGVTSVAWADSSADTPINEMEPILMKVEEEAEEASNDTETPEELGYEEPMIIDGDLSYTRDEETGHISIPQDNDVEDVDLPSTYGISPDGASVSDAAYHWYKQVIEIYPETRNQNPYGTCWAHAAVACGEFDMVTDGVLPASGADFSELQLAWNMYHTGNDRLGNLDGDEVYLASDAAYDFLDIGGNIYYAQHILANWKGLAFETTFPYSDASSTYSLSGWQIYQNNMARLENSRQLNINSNRTAVKQAIIDNGAVYASYYHDSAYYSLDGYSMYYNDSNPGKTNHAIAIVGWNDNFAASNFVNATPPGNGAWLVRNSWSTANNGSEYCYFYMSYYDTSLADAAYSLEFGQGDNNYTDDNNYDHIYQHDGAPIHSAITGYKLANMFTVANPDSYNSQTLEAVMISSTMDTSCDYKIQIYTGCGSSPESGYLHSNATTYVSTTYSGIYTFKLKNPVYLKPGEKYSIVVTPTNGGYIDIERDATISGWFCTNASADAGESFYQNYSGSSWTDVTYNDYYNNYYGNICIKGLTNNSTVSKYTISYKMNGGTNNSSNPVYYLSTTGTTTLKTPTRSGYHFLGWYTDSSFKNKITSFSGSTAKNLTLYAKWEAHDFATEIVKQKATMSEDGLLDMKCTGCSSVESYYILHPTSAKLSYTKTTYSGSRKRPTVTVKTENGTVSSSLYSVSYSNNLKVGRGKVTITLPSKYYEGSLVRRFSIVPKAPSSSTAKLYGYDDVKFSWSKSTGADGYYVYYKRSTSDSYTYWGKTTKRYAKIKNLKDGKKYTFKVVPYFKSGDTRYKSLQSKKSSTYTLKKVSLKSFKKSDGKVSVRWYNISGETGYQISRSTKKSGTNIVATYKTTKGTYKKVKATKGKTYYYKVRAYKTVKIDGKTKKIYGPWSKVKKYVR